MKLALDEKDKELLSKALELYNELQDKHYKDNPAWFSRDLYEIFEDLIAGYDWESQ